MATFIPALAYERFGRKPEKAQQWAVLDEMVRGKRRMESSTQQKFASPHEVEVLLAETTSTGWPEWRTDRIRILLVLLFYGLLRISEALSLKKDDVKEERDFWSFSIRDLTDVYKHLAASKFFSKIKVRPASHGSLYFHSEVRMVRQRPLENQVQTNRVPPNFQLPRRRMVSECSSFGNKKVVPRSPLSPHCFRRGGATHALEDGTETAAIQMRGRWRNPRSMNPYVSASAATQGGPARIPSDLWFTV
ncbi:site-specific recombinase, phage integrase family [Ancylostoma duodenale]|uniref:Site-specific recombinase, phage integrase family n=1 Tax=Ancylostoma duodenale TaxID=51022 RepID=A0A0C2H3F1_9BILA|nr:site-specific recombinase, phage integrase family [Ancylostoma duodenale]